MEQRTRKPNVLLAVRRRFWRGFSNNAIFAVSEGSLVVKPFPFLRAKRAWTWMWPVNELREPAWIPFFAPDGGRPLESTRVQRSGGTGESGRVAQSRTKCDVQGSPASQAGLHKVRQNRTNTDVQGSLAGQRASISGHSASIKVSGVAVCP
jgi:hypothetical protein